MPRPYALPLGWAAELAPSAVTSPGAPDDAPVAVVMPFEGPLPLADAPAAVVAPLVAVAVVPVPAPVPLVVGSAASCACVALSELTTGPTLVPPLCAIWPQPIPSARIFSTPSSVTLVPSALVIVPPMSAV